MNQDAAGPVEWRNIFWDHKPPVFAREGDLWVDRPAKDIYIFFEGSWQCPGKVVEEPPPLKFSKADEEFLLALAKDRQRLVMYTRKGVLEDDHGHALLRLKPGEVSEGQKPWEVMYEKVAGLFCAACFIRVEQDGLCRSCADEIRFSLELLEMILR